LLAVVAGLLGSCAEEPAAAVAWPTAKRHVVLIVVCTLRADHLPFYGYDRDTAPFLSELAADGAVFDHAFSTSGWTAPSTASLHTGLYPQQHGVIFGMTHTQHLQEADPTIVLNRIPDEVETMAEVLQADGYKTFAVTDNLNLCEEEGFTQGFDRFQNFHYAGAERVAAKLLEWQDEVDSAERSFVYLNFFDPHLPYHKRAGWYPDDEPGLEQPYRAAPGTSAERLLEEVTAAYDSEIRRLDRHIEALFERFGWRDNALVVFTSDHGEELQDHGGWQHGFTLYQEVVHVPLMVHAPTGGVTARRITSNASLVDVLPTLRELLGLPTSATDVGRSFAAELMGADRAAPERYLFGHLERRESALSPAILERFAVRGDWKYISSAGKPEGALYDLRRDAREQRNLVREDTARAIQLVEALQEFEESAPRFGQESVEIKATPELIEELKRLGYVK